MNKLKSYSSLGCLKRFFENEEVKSIFNGFPDGTYGTDLESLVKTCVGLAAFGLTIPNSIEKFQTNRYLQEALGIETLPTFQNLERFIENTTEQSLGIILGFQNIYASNSSRNATTNFDAIQNLTDVLLNVMASEKLVPELITLENSPYTSEKKKQFDEEGYLILEGVLSEEFTTRLEKIVKALAEWENSQNVAFRYGSGDRLQRVYNLLNKHPAFHELLNLPVIHHVLEDVFDRDTYHDKYGLCSFHANIIGGGGDEGMLHVDAAVSEPLPPWIIRTNINYVIHDYTESNGATEVLPGSHKICSKPKKEDQNREDLVKLLPKRGDIVMWNGHIWHKSGENKSNHDRIALLSGFAASHLKEMCLEEDHLSIIDKEVQDSATPLIQKLIGKGHGLKKGALVKPPQSILDY